MKNLVQDGDIITLTAPYDVLSGQGVLVGMIFGVCQYNALTGVEVEARVRGVFDLAKAPSQAWATIGLPIYWDNTNKRTTTVATANKFVGYSHSIVAGGAGDLVGRVILSFSKDVVG